MKNVIAFFLTFGIGYIIVSIFTPTYSESEISKSPISGKIDTFHYKYIYGTRVSPSGITYILRLNNYYSNFIIQTENYLSFKKKLFEKTVKKGDSIFLIVQKDFIDSKSKSCSVFGVSKGETNYLTKDESLSDYKYSRNVILCAGGICLLISLILYYLKEKYY
ncbi:MAG: hypothetical protein K9G64_02535 [Bacteroidia bacterium]|nr:hypothetical protein [Bacteroidia bacterium]